jgi:hypothetical protein
MKKCHYCAEDIKDDALVCRYCGRPCLQDAKSISYLGPLYALGREVSGSFALWNVASGGGPTFIAENTDRGWKTAYGKFKSLHKEQSTSGLFWGISFPLDW